MLLGSPSLRMETRLKIGWIIGIIQEETKYFKLHVIRKSNGELPFRHFHQAHDGLTILNVIQSAKVFQDFLHILLTRVFYHNEFVVLHLMSGHGPADGFSFFHLLDRKS